MNKKIHSVCTFILLLTLLFILTNVYAEGGLSSITGTTLNDQLSFTLDNKTVTLVGDNGSRVLPISYNGTTYLPVRAMGYLLGLGIDYKSSTKTILITSTTSKVPPKAINTAKTSKLIPVSGAMLSGQLLFKLDNKPVVPVGDDGSPVHPISYNGTTYLPLRALCNLLRLEVDYKSAIQTITLTRNNTAQPSGKDTVASQGAWVLINTIDDNEHNQNDSSFYKYSSSYNRTAISAGWSCLSGSNKGESLSVSFTWDTPPKAFKANEIFSPKVTVVPTTSKVLSLPGTIGAQIYFDASGLEIGKTTSKGVSFYASNGSLIRNAAYAGGKQTSSLSVLSSGKAFGEGKPGDKMSLYYGVYGWSYGTEYVYEWQANYQNSTTAANTDTIAPVDEGKTYTDGQGNNVLVPSGVKAFADKVVSYTAGSPAPGVTYQDTKQALGEPNFNSSTLAGATSLGGGGKLVLEFSQVYFFDGPGIDLHIFEVGPAVEASNIEISADGKTWINVGKISGGTASIDLKDYVSAQDTFSYVRLTDLKTTPSGSTAGADIDAVAAINSILK